MKPEESKSPAKIHPLATEEQKSAKESSATKQAAQGKTGQTDERLEKSLVEPDDIVVEPIVTIEPHQLQVNKEMESSMKDDKKPIESANSGQNSSKRDNTASERPI